MKKIRRILFVFIVFISIAILSGCGQTKEQLIQEMKEVYLEQNKERHPEATLEDITIEYYGKYGKGHIILIQNAFLSRPSDNLIKEYSTAGISFYYKGQEAYDVYYNKEFYSLETAYYEEGIVTLEDLEKFKKNLQKNYYPEEYKLFQEMKEGYVEKYLVRFPEATIDDVYIKEYYGEYGKAHIIKMSSSFFLTPSMECYIEVAGIKFWWPDFDIGIVYYKRQFYDIAEAYDQGILTYQDLKDFKAVLNPDDV